MYENSFSLFSPFLRFYLPVKVTPPLSFYRLLKTKNEICVVKSVTICTLCERLHVTFAPTSSPAAIFSSFFYENADGR